MLRRPARGGAGGASTSRSHQGHRHARGDAPGRRPHGGSEAGSYFFPFFFFGFGLIVSCRLATVVEWPFCFSVMDSVTGSFLNRVRSWWPAPFRLTVIVFTWPA